LLLSSYGFFKNIIRGTAMDINETDAELEDKGIEIAEGKIDNEAGLREDLVCQEDIALVTKMSKDELKKYAHSRLDKKLDLTRRIKMLRLDVVMLIKDKLKLSTDTSEKSNETEVKILEDEKPEFIFQPKRRRVFEWTEVLSKKDDLIECWLVDKKGKRL
jgi:hypothetical protein